MINVSLNCTLLSLSAWFFLCRLEWYTKFLRNSWFCIILWWYWRRILWLYVRKLLQQALDHFVAKVTLRCHQWPKWFTPTLQHQLNYLHILRRKYSKKLSTSSKSKLHGSSLAGPVVKTFLRPWLYTENIFQALASTARYEYEGKVIDAFPVNNNYSVNEYISSLTKHHTFPTTTYYGSDHWWCFWH